MKLRYQSKTNEKFFAIVSLNKRTKKPHIWVQVGRDEESLHQWLNINEKEYKIIQVKPIENIQALKVFCYYNKFPIKDTMYKFDLIKYILNAKIDEKHITLFE